MSLVQLYRSRFKVSILRDATSPGTSLKRIGIRPRRNLKWPKRSSGGHGKQGAHLEWRSATTRDPLSRFIAAEGCSADLILTGIVSEVALGAAQKLRIGELAMEEGRPLLIVPTVAEALKLDWVFIAWRDAGEGRRAVSDALPLLRQAGKVTVCGVYAGDDRAGAVTRCKSVVAWLQTHGVTAAALPSPSTHSDAGDLWPLAQGAHLIVGAAMVIAAPGSGCLAVSRVICSCMANNSPWLRIKPARIAPP